MKRYFTIFILLFVTEVVIAAYHFHSFIRGFIGDVLVIPLLYTLLRFFATMSIKKALLIVLIFAFTIEILQFFRLAEILSIENEALQIIIGSTFDPKDLLAYLLGSIPVLLIEKYLINETV